MSEAGLTADRRSLFSGRFGFTLIEILTVIVIIGILAGLILPAIKAATDKAKSARARTMVQHIGASFRAYFSENSMWPTNSDENSTFDLKTNLFKNAASITFLDVSPKDIVTVVVGGVTNIYIGDPWRHPYHCIIDGLNYKGYVNSPFAGGGQIAAGYLIWSDGPDGTNNPSAPEDVGLNKDNIRSW